MAYYFAVETEQDNYQGKNIKKSGYFGSKPTYQKYGECTLEEIEKFTTLYPNEAFLKKCLFSEGIITEKDRNKSLAIFYLDSDTQRLVTNKLLYRDSKLLIENPSFTIHSKLQKKVDEKDFGFLNGLLEILDDTTRKGLIFDLIQKIKSDYQYEYPNETVLYLKTISDLLTYKYTEGECLQPTDEIDYENIHKIALYIRNYEINLFKKTTKSRILTK